MTQNQHDEPKELDVRPGDTMTNKAHMYTVEIAVIEVHDHRNSKSGHGRVVEGMTLTLCSPGDLSTIVDTRAGLLWSDVMLAVIRVSCSS